MAAKGRLVGLLGILVTAQGLAFAQPATGVTLRCVPISRCVATLRDPRIGTNIRPTLERFVLQLPVDRTRRILNVQVIADRAGRIDLNTPEVIVLNSRRFGQSASRMKSLIDYRCLRGTSKGGATEYFCRMVK
ncbi:hypothetical protein GCM10022631_13100 [Deinococcus rubellus]|uniref:Uncharacterized protein n=1 Tax=Deinococcus rubellus TaxID=1889240 RepID=A0ABY5YEJ3_9DEIO|nr:hypothetical protein [Deinococcus rubellus]UWX63265.1 hypothetical protein N0D28_10955 [Deinococcus rubellus]